MAGALRTVRRACAASSGRSTGRLCFSVYFAFGFFLLKGMSMEVSNCSKERYPRRHAVPSNVFRRDPSGCTFPMRTVETVRWNGFCSSRLPGPKRVASSSEQYRLSSTRVIGNRRRSLRKRAIANGATYLPQPTGCETLGQTQARSPSPVPPSCHLPRHEHAPSSADFRCR